MTLYSQDNIFLEICHNPHTDRVKLVPTLKELTSRNRNVDLASSRTLRHVTSVVGTIDDNRILGNDLDNYLAGEGGRDFLSGKEGADTYVVKVPSPESDENGDVVSGSHCQNIKFGVDGKTNLYFYLMYISIRYY